MNSELSIVVALISASEDGRYPSLARYRAQLEALHESLIGEAVVPRVAGAPHSLVEMLASDTEFAEQATLVIARNAIEFVTEQQQSLLSIQQIRPLTEEERNLAAELSSTIESLDRLTGAGSERGSECSEWEWRMGTGPISRGSEAE